MYRGSSGGSDNLLIISGGCRAPGPDAYLAGPGADVTSANSLVRRMDRKAFLKGQVHLPAFTAALLGVT